MVANVQDALDVGDRDDRELAGRMRYVVLTRRVVSGLKFRRRGLSTRFILTLIHSGLPFQHIVTSGSTRYIIFGCFTLGTSHDFCIFLLTALSKKSLGLVCVTRNLGLDVSQKAE